MSSLHSDMWEAPDRQFTKTILSKGFGYYCPQDGSVCKIKVISDESKILTDVDGDLIKELIVGDVDDPIEKILEGCVRSMKNGEICVLSFPDPLHPCPIDEKITDFDKCASSNEVVKKDNSDVFVSPDQDAHMRAATEDIDAKDNTTDVKETREICEFADENMDKCTNAGECEIENSCSSENMTIGENCDDKSMSEVQVSSESIESKSLNNVDNQEEMADSEDYDSQSLKIYVLQLQLLSYTREPEIWEMSITEKWRRANYHKQKGMELYSRGSYEWAFRRFSTALKYLVSLEHDIPSGHEEGMNISDLKLSCYLNLGACQMRHHNYPHVVKNCSKALELQSSNPKALYRRGAAYVQLQEYEKAKEDLDKALELEPKNQSIMKQQQLLKARVHKLNQYYAKAMKKMFS